MSEEQVDKKYEENIIDLMSYFTGQLDDVIKPSFEQIKSIIDNTNNETENSPELKNNILEEFNKLNTLLNGEYINNYFKLCDSLVLNKENSENIVSSSSELNKLEYDIINQYIVENKDTFSNNDNSSSDSNVVIFYELLSIMTDLAYPQFKKNYIPDYEFVTLDDGEPIMKFKLRLNGTVKKIFHEKKELLEMNDNMKEFEIFLKELEQELISGFQLEQQEKTKILLHIQVDLINRYNELKNNLDNLNLQKEELDNINIEKQVNDLLSSLRNIINK
ncbi:hypothetical protein HANVADRAFT_52025 [Hanseniaspora valbyensis NRRL Y-1626]|uniref:Uncharacterized protein n=1 Tax=Hanseniaspora valbyensis NRRL Y-1626 TaxID=766949 RepID=A0A1B7TGR4_9ASCO|nr:hypothetical protein HANVADRAFT_52025 [Hanseniaspora valbyensis NRRL Y-1626]